MRTQVRTQDKMTMSRMILLALSLSIGIQTSVEAVAPLMVVIVAGGIGLSSALGLSVGFILGKEQYCERKIQTEEPVPVIINDEHYTNLEHYNNPMCSDYLCVLDSAADDILAERWLSRDKR